MNTENYDVKKIKKIDFDWSLNLVLRRVGPNINWATKLVTTKQSKVSKEKSCFLETVAFLEERSLT